MAAVVAFQQHQGIVNSSSNNNNTQQERFEGKESWQNWQTDQTKAVVAFQQHSFKISDSSNKNTAENLGEQGYHTADLIDQLKKRGIVSKKLL